LVDINFSFKYAFLFFYFKKFSKIIAIELGKYEIFLLNNLFSNFQINIYIKQKYDCKIELAKFT